MKRLLLIFMFGCSLLFAEKPKTDVIELYEPITWFSERTGCSFKRVKEICPVENNYCKLVYDDVVEYVKIGDLFRKDDFHTVSDKTFHAEYYEVCGFWYNIIYLEFHSEDELENYEYTDKLFRLN